MHTTDTRDRNAHDHAVADQDRNNTAEPSGRNHRPTSNRRRCVAPRRSGRSAQGTLCACVKPCPLRARAIAKRARRAPGEPRCRAKRAMREPLSPLHTREVAGSKPAAPIVLEARYGGLSVFSGLVALGRVGGLWKRYGNYGLRGSSRYRSGRPPVGRLACPPTQPISGGGRRGQ